MLRCWSTEGRYVISLSEKTTLALLLPATAPPEALAALEAALGRCSNLASDVVLEDGEGEAEGVEEGGDADEGAEGGAERGATDDSGGAASAASSVHRDAAMAAASVEASAARQEAAHAARTKLVADHASAAVATATSAASSAAAGAARAGAALRSLADAAGFPRPKAETAAPASAAPPNHNPEAAAAAAVANAASALSDMDLLEHVDAEKEQAQRNADEVKGVAARIAKGGELVADVVVRGKDFASRGVHVVGALVKHKVAPTAQRRKVTVAPSAKQAIRGTHRLTEIALEGSKFALSTAAYTFKFVGTSVSATVQETKLYQKAMALAHARARAAEAAAAAAAAERAAAGIATPPPPKTLSGDVHKAKVVAGTVLTSCLGVYRTCKVALWEFTDDLKTLTVDIAEHYYGDDVAAAAGETFDAVRNVGTIMINVDAMPSGATNVALNVAKESGLDILSLDEWLSGDVQAHGHVEMFSPIATWVPQWLLLRSSALLIYNVCTGKATRPFEVITIGDLSAAVPSLPGADDGFHFDFGTQDSACYRVRVRSAEARDAWVAAIAAAIAAKKQAAAKVVLPPKEESLVQKEEEELEAWTEALAAKLAAWEESAAADAAKAREAKDSWETLRGWASAEARAAAAEAAAEAAALASRVPAAVEAALPGDVRAGLSRARAWAVATLRAAPRLPDSALAAAEEAARAFVASRRCGPEAPLLLQGGSPTALTAAARDLLSNVEASLEAALPALPPIPPAALDKAREWAESVEGALSPATAAAAKRDAEAAAKRKSDASASQPPSPQRSPAARDAEEAAARGPL